MRDLIGHLVGRKGAERGAARIAVGISQEFLPRDDDAATDGAAVTDSVATGRPISIVYAGENILNPAIFEIAGAIPGFGLFD
jgi:hypothetical protein